MGEFGLHTIVHESLGVLRREQQANLIEIVQKYINKVDVTSSWGIWIIRNTIYIPCFMKSKKHVFFFFILTSLKLEFILKLSARYSHNVDAIAYPCVTLI